MPLLEATFDEVANQMQVGDPIFFGRAGLKTPMHVATVSTAGSKNPDITEAMFFKGVYSVELELAMRRIGRWGSVHWIPLLHTSLTQREVIGPWLLQQENKDYDWEAWAKQFLNMEVEENYDELMCLEVSVGCLKHAGVVANDVNPAMMNTADFCKLLSDRRLVYNYYQIKGRRKPLPWLERSKR